VRWQRSARSGSERYDLWTRAGLYALLALVPLLALGLVRGQQQVRPPGVTAFLLLSVAQAGICVALLRASLSRYLATGPGPGRRLVAAGIALTAGSLLAAAWAIPAFARTTPGQIPVSALAIVLLGGALAVALTPLLSLALLLALTLISGGTAILVAASAGRPGPAVIGGLACVVGIGAAVLTYRASAWSLRIIWELHRSRAAHARLSVAEERLRFARDLHDVLGRNLSLIAVKSELAAELAARGDAAAAGHMLEVRGVAHESQREMRAVVSGYRAADLAAELAGAQAVLRSAGATCRVVGDASGLSQAVQAALGWVVREGTTNIIRHSDASACVIEVDVRDVPGAASTVMLRMDNDRVRSADADGTGTGLLGLAERVAAVGGAITACQPRSGHFRLEATLPTSGPVPVP
jgi:two-component system, NarL family, sensor histidine kinase DesK